MAAVPHEHHAAAAPLRLPQSEGEATRLLYERHQRKILAFCQHQLGNREEAEDATQITFMNAFRGLRRGTSPEFETAWLYKIAHNVCLTKQRNSYRRRLVEAPSDFELIEELVPAHEGDADELFGLTGALRVLPEQQRRALLLREWKGLSYREIADELQLSQAAVETLLFRARRSLAEALSAGPVERRKRGRPRAVSGVGSGLATLQSLLVGGGMKVAAGVATVAATSVVAAPAVHRDMNAILRSDAADRPAAPHVVRHTHKPVATPVVLLPVHRPVALSTVVATHAAKRVTSPIVSAPAVHLPLVAGPRIVAPAPDPTPAPTEPVPHATAPAPASSAPPAATTTETTTTTTTTASPPPVEPAPTTDPPASVPVVEAPTAAAAPAPAPAKPAVAPVASASAPPAPAPTPAPAVTVQNVIQPTAAPTDSSGDAAGASSPTWTPPAKTKYQLTDDATSQPAPTAPAAAAATDTTTATTTADSAATAPAITVTVPEKPDKPDKPAKIK